VPRDVCRSVLGEFFERLCNELVAVFLIEGSKVDWCELTKEEGEFIVASRTLEDKSDMRGQCSVQGNFDISWFAELAIFVELAEKGLLLGIRESQRLVGEMSQEIAKCIVKEIVGHDDCGRRDVCRKRFERLE
jgi:hypothetical protein